MSEYFQPGFRVVGAIAPEVVEQWGELVPAEVEDAWVNDGAMISADGFARLIDPATLLPVMDELLPSHPGALPVFATAWGDLIVFHEDTFVLVLFRYGFYVTYSPFPTGFVFNDLEDPREHATRLQRGIYDDAVAALGVPTIDECLGFVLPLSAGGQQTVDNVARRPLNEHLAFLVQVGGAPKNLDDLAPAAPGEGGDGEAR
jgi:hypothetical protein